jgi:membrane-associated phospholipid phosphatase
MSPASLVAVMAGLSFAGVVAVTSPSFAQTPPAPAGDDEAGPPRASAAPPRAEPPRDTLEWRHPTFRTSEYIATGAFVGIALGGLFIPVDPPRWTGPNGLDSAARDALRLEGRDIRGYADDTSDVTLALSINYMLFDSLVIAWWARDKGTVAYEMTMIDIETLAFTNAVTSVVKGITARERPYAEECDRSSKYGRTDDCDADARYRSFFSGHTSTTFAAASVNCMHHANLGLYGAGGDVAACIAGYSVAAGTGVLRIMSDNHNLTDVTVGAAFGTLAGLGLPWLLHYREDSPPKELSTATPPLRVQLVPGPMSATLVGEF